MIYRMLTSTVLSCLLALGLASCRESERTALSSPTGVQKVEAGPTSEGFGLSGPAANQVFKLAIGSSSFCLSKIRQFALVSCTDSATEQFTKLDSTESGKEFVSFKASSGECIDVYRMFTQRATPANTYICGSGGGWSQKFRPSQLADGSFRFRYLLNENMCLDLTTYKPNLRAKLIISDCDEASETQKFRYL